jgi:hypothetical protein
MPHPQTQMQRQAVSNLIMCQNPDVMITFNYQRQVQLDQMRQHIDIFMNKMQRRVLGSRWMSVPAIERPRLLGMAEHLDSNSHVHVAMSGTERFVDFVLGEEAQELWKSVHPRCGQFHAKRIREQERTARYITKYYRRPEDADKAVYYVPKGLN